MSEVGGEKVMITISKEENGAREKRHRGEAEGDADGEAEKGVIGQGKRKMEKCWWET